LVKGIFKGFDFQKVLRDNETNDFKFRGEIIFGTGNFFKNCKPEFILVINSQHSLAEHPVENGCGAVLS